MTTTQKFWVLALLLALSAAMARAEEDGGEETTKHTMSYTWKVKAEYPNLGVETTDRVLQEWLEKYIEKCVSETSGLASVDPDYPEGNWEMGITYDITKPSEKIASVLFIVYTYPSGAAHPMTTLSAVNLDITEGKRLELADLFEDPRQAVAIMSENAQQLINEHLKQEYGDVLPNGIEDDAWFKNGFDPVPENFSCLSLEPEGVRVHFQQYQVLPYVFGLPNALIPLSLFEPARPNRNVWPKQ